MSYRKAYSLHRKLCLSLPAWLLACSAGSTGGTSVTTSSADESDAGTLPSRPDGSGPSTPTSDGSSGPTTADDNLCDSYVARAESALVDVLIVLDRSGSMKSASTQICIPGPCGTNNRWDPSVSALREVVASLEDRVRFGLMLFPDPTYPDDACAAGSVVVPTGLHAGASIDQALSAAGEPAGATPTSTSLEAARKALSTAVGPDEVTPDRYVLLVTDGQPNCVGTKSLDRDPEAEQASYAAIDGLRSDGVKTYVVGYETERFASVMDEMATRGGTDRYYPVAADSLVPVLEKLTGTLVSCTHKLDKPLEAGPEYVRVKIDGKQVNRDEGWVMQDEQTLLLVGATCEGFRDGAEHTLSINVECKPVPLI